MSGFGIGLKSHRKGIANRGKIRSQDMPVIDLLTHPRRRVYLAAMKDMAKRDNAYWLRRLEKDGHADLLAQIDAGDITVYMATKKAGYRKTGPQTPAASLSHHWARADAKQRKLFVYEHRYEINRLLRQMIDNSQHR